MWDGISYLRKHESSSNPNSASTKSKSSCKSLVVEDTTCSNDLHWLASHGRLVALAETDNLWDQDGCWDISSVASSFTTLGADHVDAELEALLDVLGVADHVHVEDPGFVELVDDLLGWDTNGGDEETGAGVDDDVNEFAELALGVVVAVGGSVLVHVWYYCLCIHLVLLGLSCAATDLWEEQVDTEWSVLVLEEALELCNLLAEHVWGVADTTNDTDTASIGHGSSELRTSIGLVASNC